LEIETLVSMTPVGEARAPSLRPEQQTVLLACRDLLSLAEISARLEVPLGVARVLVGDMADAGLIRLHRPIAVAPASGERQAVALLERVLDGLRKL